MDTNIFLAASRGKLKIWSQPITSLSGYMAMRYMAMRVQGVVDSCLPQSTKWIHSVRAGYWNLLAISIFLGSNR